MEKKLSHFPQSISIEKAQKMKNIHLKHIQFKVISYIKSNKIHKSLKIPTIATMELYLLKIYKILINIPTRGF